ncbi:hypothetical protein E3E38_10190 [Thermococcus sp. 18S1]|uniref:hypothetical protein n=1 Tax=Thermococcus sp. 18S1 TaxID=1638210 RepID=UPI001439B42F|nr:hypothetical protein [Thermococcus sp. 18S1]NJE31411.1 hypothetical protein [Thermococcus sp. 18S1]
MPEERELHYLVTRIINPTLNWVIVALRSNHVVYGREGYTGLKWTDHTLGDYFASELEDWKNALWYKYKDNFLEKAEEILDSLLDIMVRMDARLQHDNKQRIMNKLWEMVGETAEYLQVEGYVEAKREEFARRVEEIKKYDEKIKKKLEELNRDNDASETNTLLQSRHPKPLRLIDKLDLPQVWLDALLVLLLVSLGFVVAYLLFGKGWWDVLRAALLGS